MAGVERAHGGDEAEAMLPLRRSREIAAGGCCISAGVVQMSMSA